MSKKISFTKVLDPLGLFTKEKKPKAPTTPEDPQKDAAAIEEARRKQVEENARSRGRAGTYLGQTTSPSAQLGRKTFLGA